MSNEGNVPRDCVGANELSRIHAKFLSHLFA